MFRGSCDRGASYASIHICACSCVATCSSWRPCPVVSMLPQLPKFQAPQQAGYPTLSQTAGKGSGLRWGVRLSRMLDEKHARLN